MNAEALTINDIIDFVKENIDDTKFAKDMLEISLRGFITALVEQEKEAYHKERVNDKAILDKETAIRLHRLIKDLISDNPEICPYEILAIKELENQVNNLLKQ